MKTVKTIRTAFGERAKRPERLERMLAELEQQDIGALPYDQRSKLLQHFTDAVYREAEEKRIFYWNPKTRFAHVYEPPFEREIRQIIRLLESFRLSDYMSQWAAGRAKELGGELEKIFPYKDVQRAWPGLSLAHKKVILEDIVKLQCGIFCKGAIDFLPSPVRFQSGLAIAGFVEARSSYIYSLTIPPLNIYSRASFETAAKAAVHEQIHSMCMQLAIAAHLGQMPEAHPMAEDAKKLLSRHKYFAYGTALIKSAYNADPEENITHPAHEAFLAGYAKSAFARAMDRIGLGKAYEKAKAVFIDLRL